LRNAPWDWSRVERVLVVRLRSIGDTVLATPALAALRRFLPQARLDILLEDWVAPILVGSPDVDRILTLRRRSLIARLRLLPALRAARYDVAFDLHGGTTATLLTFATGACERVGYARYQYARLLTRRAPPSAQLWGQEAVHSVEEQLALLGFVGVPVSDRPATRLPLAPAAVESVAARLQASGIAPDQPLALLHPMAAFESKRWSLDGFAAVATQLHARRLAVVALVAPGEREALARLRAASAVPVAGFADLALPEVAALAARARVFVGNDSGIAHIAAAVRAPVVVVFGSSNVTHWRPWATAPAEVVRQAVPCAPCPGYTCREPTPFGCIKGVTVDQVLGAIERVLVAAG
jgi:predicted lipopolysaccharide heptosyltransferase III